MCGEIDGSVVMRSPCAGAALDPPLRIVPNKALSHKALSLSKVKRAARRAAASAGSMFVRGTAENLKSQSMP